MEGESKAHHVLRTLTEKDQGLLRKKIFSLKSEDSNGCWNWLGAKNNKGYGYIRFRNTSLSSHRASFAAFRERLTNGLFACHRCDNPSCVNPEHLFSGTRKDNSEDMVIKGRQRKPKRNSHCKIGHEYTPENEILHPVFGYQTCRICTNLANKIKLRQWRAAKKLSAKLKLNI